MKEHALYISFAESTVEVYSKAPEVIKAIRQRYKFMLTLESDKIIKRIAIQRHESGYHIAGDLQSKPEDASFDKVLECLEFELVQNLIETQPQFLFLHSGAVASSGKAVVITGVSGRGKSTLVSHLCKQGWEYLSDEIVPIDLSSDKILPFPRMVYVRRNIEGRAMTPALLRDKSIKSLYIPNTLCQTPVTIGAVVLPVYNPEGQTTLKSCSPSVAVKELLINCVNFSVHQAKAFHYLCKLVEQVPLFRLPYYNAEYAINLLQEETENLWGTSPDM